MEYQIRVDLSGGANGIKMVTLDVCLGMKSLSLIWLIGRTEYRYWKTDRSKGSGATKQFEN